MTKVTFIYRSRYPGIIVRQQSRQRKANSSLESPKVNVITFSNCRLLGLCPRMSRGVKELRMIIP